MGGAIRKALAVATVILVLAGCSGSPSSGGSAGAGGDSAAVAVAAASAAVADLSPDAVLTALGSGGVVFSPPPAAWSLIFVSPSTKDMWRVRVEEDGTAGTPEDLGVAKAVTAEDLAAAVTYDSVGVTPQQAYDAAVAVLGTSTEGLGVQMGVAFAEPSITGVLGQWSVVFTKGTSTEGARRFLVAPDGTATEVTD